MPLLWEVYVLPSEWRTKRSGSGSTPWRATRWSGTTSGSSGANASGSGAAASRTRSA